MVGYHPGKQELTWQKHAASGMVSGAITRALCQPFDVIKIRFQLQHEPISKQHHSKYTGIRQCMKSVCREEGCKAFWKGHLASQTVSLVYGPVMFVSFEVLTKFIWNWGPEKWSTDLRPITHALCGGLAGCGATLVVQPLDVTRTRLVAQGEPKIYKGILHAWRCMYAQGWRTFFQGLGPTLFIQSETAFRFGFYDLFKSWWSKKWSQRNHRSRYAGSFESLLCGSAAGICAKVTVYPLDLVKKRLQVQGFEEARKTFGEVKNYTNMWNCLTSIVREEGAIGLYKGLSPTILKAAAVTGLTFFVYEQCCRVLTVLSEKPKV